VPMLYKKCATRGCAEMVAIGVRCCPACEREGLGRPPDRRASSPARGYDRRYRAVSDAYKRAHPLCEDCLEVGVTTPVYDTHHMIPIRRGGRHARSNLRSVCRHHH